MGKQVSTLKMTGSFAGAVGYIDKQGRVQMRSKAEAYHDANTKEQRTVRTKFLSATTLAKAMAKAALGLNPAAKSHRLTLRNEFVKQNYNTIDVVATADGMEGQVDYTLIKLSQGDLPEVSFGSPQFDEPLTVAVAFGKNSDIPGASDSDLVYIAAYNPGDGRILLSTPVRRDVAAGSVSLTVPNSWNGETVHVYGFAQGFNTEEERVKYLSAFNDHSVAPGEAQAIINKLASGSIFSESHYIGNGSIS